MSDQTFFWHRLRWRFRGAWMWPVFTAVTLGEGILLWRLPPVGTGLNLVEGVLLATFGNLVLIAALGPWLANRLAARQRPAPSDTERQILKDRVSTGLLVAGVFGCLASGLAARPSVIGETEAKERAAKALLAYVQRSDNQELRRNNEASDMIRLAEDYFRACVPRDDRRRAFCFFIDTDGERARIVRDPSAEPNNVYKVP